MTNFDSLVCFGFSPTMLFPKSFDDPLTHFACIQICSHYPHYETFETFLPEDKAMREACIREMKAHGKQMRYNLPGVLQVDGPFYPISDDPATRARAIEFAKMHVDFAGEAESTLIAATTCTDRGEELRPEMMKRYTEYFLQMAEHAKQYGMNVLLEPIERHRFKKSLLGPTEESAAFIADMQRQGADNAHLMLDMAHLPLMEENVDDAIAASLPVGLLHVHMGDAVLDPYNVFYGHTHPPVAVQGGMFDLPELTEQFVKLFECGFIPKAPGEKRASISLEVRPYPGVSEATSIQLMYEKMRSAFDAAAGQLGIYS